MSSIDTRLPADMQLLVRRIPRAGVRFLAEVDESIAELVALYRKSEAA